jgi:hypothetical protein
MITSQIQDDAFFTKQCCRLYFYVECSIGRNLELRHTIDLIFDSPGDFWIYYTLGWVKSAVHHFDVFYVERQT